MPSIANALTLSCGFVFAVLVGCSTPPPHHAAEAYRCSELREDRSAEVLYTAALQRVERIDRLTRRRGFEEFELEGASFRLSANSIDEKSMARALACHAAHADVPALARVAPSFDPLRPGGGKVWVAVERQGVDVIVRVTSPDEDVAAEILERANLLATRATVPPAKVASDP